MIVADNSPTPPVVAWADTARPSLPNVAETRIEIELPAITADFTDLCAARPARSVGRGTSTTASCPFALFVADVLAGASVFASRGIRSGRYRILDGETARVAVGSSDSPGSTREHRDATFSTEDLRQRLVRAVHRRRPDRCWNAPKYCNRGYFDASAGTCDGLPVARPVVSPTAALDHQRVGDDRDGSVRPPSRYHCSSGRLARSSSIRSCSARY